MVTRAFTLGPEFDLAPDDTEETLVGSTAHQGAIVALTTGLTICAERRELPWLVGNQLTVVMPRERGKQPYQPSPDILVHLTLGGTQLTSLNVAEHGPPVLAIEVTSPATARERDLHPTSPTSKVRLYEAMGILEYMVFDPVAEFLRDQVRAWRMGPHGYEPWEPEADGRWHSRSLGVSFEAQGFLLRVYDSDGTLLPISLELYRQNQQLLARVAELEAALRRRE
jgi:Uma2 family endonuclease